MRRLGLCLVLLAATAYANGRPPLTNGIHFKPGDAHSLYVATTFGLLISHDDGCTMHWICEQNIGYNGMFDPKYAIASDGTIFATTYDGLRVSRDGGCSFTTATSQLPAGDPGRIADIWIDALDIGPTGEVWVGTAESGKPNDVYVSTDNGVTFTSRGLESQTVWYKSVKVAPSNAQRVYVAGYQVAGTAADGGQIQPTAHVLHSDDDGAHWTESPLTGVTYGPTPIVLIDAVDPTNADVLYLASIGANPPAGDLLYRSADAGATWSQVLATTDAIRNVVVRDAQTVLVATQLGGSFRSTDGGKTFQPMTGAPQLACLGQRPDGSLVGCGANWQPDYMAVATSADGGVTWKKLWRFVELYGPKACPAGTAEHDICDVQQWNGVKAQFGATGPTCGANQSEGGMDAPTTKPTKKKSGCCDVGGGGPLGLVWAVGLALYLGRKRRPAPRRA